MDDWDEAECKAELRFDKSDLAVLLHALRFPNIFVCSHRIFCSGMEGLCILLKRLAFPCRYTDMMRFGRNLTELCLIFNHVLPFVYQTREHHLNSWTQPFLYPPALEQYAQSIHVRGASLQNCLGFAEVYNGQKRIHSLKFQNVVLPNGLIANLNGPYEGQRHDALRIRLTKELKEGMMEPLGTIFSRKGES